MTAVEWLIREMEALGDAVYTPEEAIKIYGEKAKEMEAEQIIEAYIKGYNAAVSSLNKITINGKSNR